MTAGDISPDAIRWFKNFIFSVSCVFLGTICSYISDYKTSPSIIRHLPKCFKSRVLRFLVKWLLQSPNSQSTHLPHTKHPVSAAIPYVRHSSLFHRNIYREMPSTMKWNHWSVVSSCCAAPLTGTTSEESRRQETSTVSKVKRNM